MSGRTAVAVCEWECPGWRLVREGRAVHDRSMLTRHSTNGGLPRLWCVELVPKRKRLGEAEMKKALRLARGMPSEPREALFWMAQVVEGLQDSREAQFARMRGRLIVFTEKKEAARRARRETNEFWSGKVREVRVV